MSTLLMAAALCASPAETASFSSFESAAASIAARSQTGTLIFNRGDCLAVKVFTTSDFTHVATIVFRDGEPFVYDSTNGKGVRRQKLVNYIRSQKPDVLQVMHPQKPFSAERSRRYGDYLENQLNRPYAIQHHLTGQRADGVHCSEYLTDALMHCGLIHAEQPSRVSPGSLAEGILNEGLYCAARRIEIHPPIRKRVADNWCERLWIDTKLCTVSCCAQLKRWFLCR